MGPKWNARILLACVALGCCVTGVLAQSRDRSVLQRTTDPVGASATLAANSTQTPNASLATARVIFIYSRSSSIDASDVEAELLGIKKFRALGLEITRDPDKADLVLEVTQGDDTVTVTYAAIDVRTKSVLAAGKATSIFGFATQMTAKDFVGKVDKARSNP